MRRRRSRPIAYVVTLLAAVAGAAATAMACTSFSADAPTAGADAGDAAVEASSEASVSPDAGLESGTQGFCAMHADAEVCSDFDNASVYAGWNVVTDDGGTVLTDEALFHSPPRSMRSAVDGTQNVDARLTRPLVSTVKRVRLSFQVQLTKAVLPSGANQLSIAEIYCGDGASNNDGAFVFVKGSAGELVVYGGADASESKGLPPLTMNAWTHVVLDAHFEGASPMANIGIGSATPVPIAIDPRCTMFNAFTVKVGLATYTASVGEAVFDDVLLEIDPTGP